MKNKQKILWPNCHASWLSVTKKKMKIIFFTNNYISDKPNIS